MGAAGLLAIFGLPARKVNRKWAAELANGAAIAAMYDKTHLNVSGYANSASRYMVLS